MSEEQLEKLHNRLNQFAPVALIGLNQVPWDRVAAFISGH